MKMEIIVINKKILYPIEDIDFLKTISKGYFTYNYFLQTSGSLKIVILAVLLIILCALRGYYL